MVQTRRPRRTFRRPSVIPGFGISFGYTLTCLGLIVLLPLAGLVVKASGLGLSGIWEVATDPRVASALRISFGVSRRRRGLSEF